MQEIIIDDNIIINAMDYEKKADEIIACLDERIFDKVENWTEKVVKGGLIVGEAPKKFNRNQLKPDLSPTKVTIEFNSLLRRYKPLSEDEAKTISDKDYLIAFEHYSRIISHISDYIMSYVPSKQTFCAFCNITTDIYNDLIQNPNYSQVFKSFEDAFVDSNFALAQAGIINTSVTLAKLQTKDAGHNLVKNPESIVFAPTFKVDRTKVNEKLTKFNSMIKSLPKK